MFDPRTEDECRSIAEGIMKGDIFTDRDLEFPEIDLGFVFLPLVLMPPQIAEALMAARPGLIFAPLCRKLPNTPKDLPPSFLCADYLSEEDAATVLAMVAEVRGNRCARLPDSRRVSGLEH